VTPLFTADYAIYPTVDSSVAWAMRGGETFCGLLAEETSEKKKECAKKGPAKRRSALFCWEARSADSPLVSPPRIAHATGPYTDWVYIAVSDKKGVIP